MKSQFINKEYSRRALMVLVLLMLALVLASCGSGQDGPVRQAPPVTVVSPVIKEVFKRSFFTGSVRASEAADIVARVPGALESVEFEPSSQVKVGDLLFTIEDERYLAARDVAQAMVASSKADLLRAETELRRVEEASESKAVSEMDVDRAKAERDMAIATVASAEATLKDAELDLSYTQVRSPIDGRVSRNLVDAGNLVGQGGPTLLTKVNKTSPIYVYFNAPESAVLKFLDARQKWLEEEGDNKKGPGGVHVALANEEGFPHEADLDFIDNEVDKNTGTIEMRAKLENTNGALFPGLFVRVMVTTNKIPDAVLVPEIALGSDLGGKYVLVVDEDNLVVQKYVKPGLSEEGGLVHIQTGLEGNERVIVGGQAMARPGMPVTPMTPEEFEAKKKQAMQEQQAKKAQG